MTAGSTRPDLFSSVSDPVRRLLGADRPEICKAVDAFPHPGHRTRLEYWWDETRRPLVVIGQNPSKATRDRADPTVTRCARRAFTLGLGGLVMTNMFSMVATDPQVMWAKPTDPDRQRENVAEIAAVLAAHPDAPILFAPGGDRETRHAEAAREIEVMIRKMGRAMSCLGTTAGGHPRHPSRCGYDVAMVPWPTPLERAGTETR